MHPKEALLEIGSEELPASFIGIGMRQLKTLAEDSLKVSGLTFTSIDVYGTPRRLAVLIHGLPAGSPDQKKIVTGPPAAIAKDAQGQWTPAALGFARKQGLKPSELAIENGKVSATLHIKGVSTKHLLAELFPQWISKLEFPKTMHWEEKEENRFLYPRPIRWVAALYGSDLVSFTIAGVRSVRWTLGIGPWAPKKIPIAQANKYILLLKNQCVLVEPAVRLEAIRRAAEQAAKRLPAGKQAHASKAVVHGKIHMSTALLEQVSNLVEHPVAILGNFDPAYLDLPKEVLITCLEHHQKYFPVEQEEKGKLLPHFVGIRNGMSMHQEIVREGYERVLAARLADARFFYNHDRETPLASKVEALQGVTFQQKLGNLFEKKERVKKFLDYFSAQAGVAESLDKAKQVADLCKADLVTDMVREFPELQGIMARLYAQADNEPADVARALEEQYWPITLSGPLPSSEIAALVSLADKLDTLAGDFAIGLLPSGSADPYGLRRAAVAVLRILEKWGWPAPLESLIDTALEQYPQAIRAARPTTKSDLAQFMRQRFTALLEERGFRSDEIESVLVNGIGFLRDTVARIQAIKALRDNKDFLVLATVFKRSSNIVRQAQQGDVGFRWTDEKFSVKENLFEHDSERELYAVLTRASDEVKGKIENKDYTEALKAILPIAGPLDRFFKEVMVMANNSDVKMNRLAMMFWMTTEFTKVADFSKLQNA